MSMIKVIAPGSQSFDEAISQLVKMSSRGLVGDDLRSFIKRAGHSFADKLHGVSLQPGEIPVHLIALGATEFYNSNRNGDGFRVPACRQYHDTFVKHARWYRNHKNKDKSKSYGIVKLSSFNEAMKRIELLVALNGTKEAAERNGGLVADKELEKLASGSDIAVSMSCRVPYDVCSECGNKAANRDEYCKGIDEGGMCKAGGLKNRIGTVLANGHTLHADNTHPDFFDISDVYRGADRIAYVFGKAASGQWLSGVDTAHELGVTAPIDVICDGYTGDVANLFKAAYMLAQAETEIEENPARVTKWALAFSNEVQPPIDGLDSVSPKDRAKTLNAFASQKIALSLRDFLCLTTGKSAEKSASLAAEASAYLPGIFNRLIEDAYLETALTNSPYRATAALATLDMRSRAVKHAADYSLDREYVNRRVLRSALRMTDTPAFTKAGVSNKKPAPNEMYEKIAAQYALYKIGLLNALPSTNNDLQLTVDLLVGQNYINQY